MQKNIYLIFILLTCMNLCQKAESKDYTPQECPAIGNTTTKIYHVSTGKLYAPMLKQNKTNKKSKTDNRKCFKTEKDAQQAGYRKSKL